MADESVRRVRTHVGDPAWQVTGYDRVKALLSDPRLGRSHPDPENAARFSESAIFGQGVCHARPMKESNRSQTADPDLARLATFWPKLSAGDRAAILALAASLGAKDAR